MKYLYKLSVILIALFIFCSCKDSSHQTYKADNGIYYWRTTFSPNDYEKEFLKKHNIQKLYIKLFDVDKERSSLTGDNIVPKATIQFKDTVLPGVDIVPTIYITTSAMEAMQLKEDVYAEKILKRVNAMCRKHGIMFNELQLDCDWTKHTQKYFFKLCEEIKQRLEPGQTLSSTIRLHQLTQTPPPVDKGVLMVYNTGNLMEMSTDNSIFSRKDIEPYLRDNRLSNYTLPLDVAYPAYGWNLVFYPGEDKYYFSRIIRQIDFSSYPQLKKIDKNIYEATTDINISPKCDLGDSIYKGYRIKAERPSAEEILKVKELIEHQLGNKPHNNILYHLDESQLSNYSENEINKIYYLN